MKKLFVIAFALMISFTSALAGDDHHDRELNRNEEPGTGGGGGTEGEIIVIIFQGWCKKAHVEGRFNHEPSYLETLGFRTQADDWCDINFGGPFSLIGVD